jgi:Domain of unknown function (DUF4184)
MPFTFSHPAAVLPLGYLPKRWVSMTGLIIGSMAPDFEYFFRLIDYSAYSHTWAGLFWFDLPLTLMLAFIYHQVVRDRLIDNLPAFLGRRLFLFKSFNWPAYFRKNFLIVIVSIIVGVATHILWDKFTHEEPHLMRAVETFKSTISIGGHTIHTYKALQLSNTIIGLLIVIYSIYQLPQRPVIKREQPVFPFWFSVGLIAAALVGTRLIFTGLHYKFYRGLIVTIISGIFLGLIVTPVLLPKKQKGLPVY